MGRERQSFNGKWKNNGLKLMIKVRGKGHAERCKKWEWRLNGRKYRPSTWVCAENPRFLFTFNFCNRKMSSRLKIDFILKGSYLQVFSLIATLMEKWFHVKKGMPFFIPSSVVLSYICSCKIDFSQIQWGILSVGFTNLLLTFSFYDELSYH